MAADDTQTGGTDNRATIAQTLAEVRGLRDLTRAEFAAVQRQLDAVGSLPVVVAELKAQNADQEKRIKAIEESDRGDRDWRRTHLPALLFAGALVVVAIVTLLVQLH